MWAATTAAVAEREAHAARPLQTLLQPGHLPPPKTALIPRKKGGLALATEWIEGADTPKRFDKSQSSRYLAALPYSDSAAVSALDTVLQERWEPTVAKEGVAFIPAVGTLSQMTTLGGASHLLCLVGAGKR